MTFLEKKSLASYGFNFGLFWLRKEELDLIFNNEDVFSEEELETFLEENKENNHLLAKLAAKILSSGPEN